MKEEKNKKKKDPIVTNHVTYNNARNIRKAYPATGRHRTHLSRTEVW